MTDTDKLKRLAEAVGENGSIVMMGRSRADAILALIAERDEAVALLREWCSVGNPMERGHCHNKTDAFLARMDTKEPK